jgi:hypothetical protein
MGRLKPSTIDTGGGVMVRCSGGGDGGGVFISIQGTGDGGSETDITKESIDTSKFALAALSKRMV